MDPIEADEDLIPDLKAHLDRYAAIKSKIRRMEDILKQMESQARSTSIKTEYRECQRNIAAAIGSHALDGCGEFMPSCEDEGTSGYFQCDACGCHRNYHKKVEMHQGQRLDSIGMPEMVDGTASVASGSTGSQLTSHLNDVTSLAKMSLEALENNAKVMMAAAESLSLIQKQQLGQRDSDNTVQSGYLGNGLPESNYDVAYPELQVGALHATRPRAETLEDLDNWLADSPTLQLLGGSSDGMDNVQSWDGGVKRKRKRTQISADQKKKLGEYAEKIGWSIAGKSKDEINRICADIGIEPKSLRYWIHNSKQKGKKPMAKALDGGELQYDSSPKQ